MGNEVAPTQIGAFGSSINYKRDNTFYVSTASGALSYNHYWFEIVPHWNGNNTSGNWDVGDYYFVAGDAEPTDPTTTYDVTYDPDNDSHHWIQVKVGGPEHAQIRFYVDDAWGLWTAFTTSYTGNGTGIDQDFSLYSWIDSILYGGAHSITGGHALQIDAECIHSAMYYAMKRMYTDYSDNNNAQLWDFNTIPSVVITAGSSTQQTTSNLTLNAYHGGLGGSGFPILIISTEEMYDREDACDGAGGNPSATKSTSSADRFGNPCGPGSRLFTMDYADTATIGDDKEPYDGSPYWDVVLGGDNLPIPTHVPTSGCIFKFGGFEAQPVIVQSALTQSAAWKDFKTFNAFTAEQADSTFAMGRHWSDTDGDRHISKLPQGPLYQEWGMESVEPWWRTVGKNYDGTDRVALSNPGGFDWTDHGDTILFDNAAENGEVYAPIPCHFICLKPGNTYKITLYATVEPQFGPVCDPDHTIEYVFDSWGPCTFNLPIGDGTTTLSLIHI